MHEHTHRHTHARAHTKSHAHTLTHAHTCTGTHTCRDTRVHAHRHTGTRTDTHGRTHGHTQHGRRRALPFTPPSAGSAPGRADTPQRFRPVPTHLTATPSAVAPASPRSTKCGDGRAGPRRGSPGRGLPLRQGHEGTSGLGGEPRPQRKRQRLGAGAGGGSQGVAPPGAPVPTPDRRHPKNGQETQPRDDKYNCCGGALPGAEGTPPPQTLLHPARMLRASRRLRWGRRGQPLAQDVQVDRGRLGQGLQPGLHVLDGMPLLGLPLPAAPHDGVDLRGAGARPLQLTPLRDALDRLGAPEEGEEGTLGWGRTGRPARRCPPPQTQGHVP